MTRTDVDIDDLYAREYAEQHGDPMPAEEPRVKLVSTAEIFAPRPPIPYMVPGLHLAPGRPALFAGYGYSGKTLALQSAGLSIATGSKIWGAFDPSYTGRVLHLDWEQGAELSFTRYQRLLAGLGLTVEDIGDRLVASVYPLLRLDDPDAEKILTDTCAGFSFVICDSFTASTARTDENSTETGKLLYMVARISEATGATIAVVHHARKPQKESAGGAIAAIRGSGSIFGASGSVYVLQAVEGQPVKVEHLRSPLSGIHLEPFSLRFEDGPAWGDPRGALRVVYEGPEALAARVSAVHDAAEERELDKVRGYLALHPDVSGNQIHPALSMKKQRCSNLVAALRDRGEIVNMGSPSKPKWRLVQTALPH